MNFFRRRQTVPDRRTADEQPRPPSVYELAKRIDQFDDVAHPSELLAGSALPKAVATLAGSPCTTAELMTFALGENGVVASLAILALAQRNCTDAGPFLLRHINSFAATWVKYFALEALERLVPAPQSLLGRILVRINDDWWDGTDRFLLQFVRETTRRRATAGEPVTFDGALARDDVWALSRIDDLLDELDKDIAAPLRAELEAFESQQTNTVYLASVGTITTDGEAAAIVEHEALRDAAQLIEQTLTAETRRSVLIVGEEGVGKTTIIRAAAKRLRAAGWVVFEAGAGELQAGQMYFGQLEQRMAKLFKNLRAPRRVVWIVPRFHELQQAGQHRYSDSSVLDTILPEVDAGRITILGEITASAHQRLVEQKRRVATAMVTVRVQPASAEGTLELARQWAAVRQQSSPMLPEPILSEAWQLTTQFLGMRAAPGNLLTLLELTLARLRAAGEGDVVMTLDDLLVTLAQLTGLPNSILDDREGLDLAALRSHFTARVLGQPEAVAALTDRVAMIKAGLCDPTRPFGVFLFAGPTGTGKTEIAKALAEYLFGSAERMIRIDMSELKNHDSLARLTGDSDGQTLSLVDAVRRQPFSVVLLDELEKAHPNIWDLFLQVFDDGRLTDRRGVTADFRHTLILMTSNAGAAGQPHAGFGEAGAPAQSAQIHQALARQFRKEFLNRIDRIVVFQPLSRETMRGILERELGEILRRRGLRNRRWAVEWEDEAIDVLLTDGFTTDLGARPLKRAIERKLLAPLAEKIVSRQTPAGDQCLVIRAQGADLRIDFGRDG